MRQCLTKRDKPSLAPINPEIRKAGPRHCLAMCLAQLGDLEAATREFQKALQEDPQSRPLRFDYARFLAAREQPVEALNLLFALATEKPEEPQAWLQGGQLALSRPEFLEVALDWTAQAQLHSPDNPAIVRHRAEALTLSGQCAEALPLWQKLQSTSNPACLAGLVLCQTVLGENEFSPPEHLESSVSQEFLKWYQRLLQFNARKTVEALNARAESLQAVLPSAARIVAAALEEAAEAVPA